MREAGVEMDIVEYMISVVIIMTIVIVVGEIFTSDCISK